MDGHGQLERRAQAPADPHALRAMELGRARGGQWAELVADYGDQARRAAPPLACALLHRAAMVCVNELRAPEQARALLRRALDLVPDDLAVLQSLGTLLCASGEYVAAAELLEREVGATQDDGARVRGLIEVADLYSEHVRRPDRALVALRQAQRLAPDEAAVAHRMGNVFARQGLLERALAAWLTELRCAGPSADRLARLLALGQRLAERPAQHGLLRQLVDALQAADPAGQALEPLRATLLQARQHWSHQVTDLMTRLTTEQDPAVVAERWLQVAELQWIYGHNPEAACACVAHALAAQPRDGRALALLEQVHLAAADAAGLGRALEALAADEADAPRAVELLLRAAMVRCVHLDDVAGSLADYEQVLLRAPGHKAACNALAEYHRARGAWPQAIEALRQWAAHAVHPADQVAAHHACWQLLTEQMGDAAGAAVHHRALLALDPTHPPPPASFAGVAVRAGHGATAPPRDGPDSSRSAAGPVGPAPPTPAIATDPTPHASRASMKSPQEQIEAWEAVLVEKPGDAEASSELARLRAVPTDAGELALHLRGQVDLAADDASKAAASLAYAEHLAVKMQDVGGAIAALQPATTLAPANPAVWQRLGTLYESQQDYVNLAGCMHREINLLPEGDDKRARLLEYAALCGQQLGDVRGALAALQAVLVSAPHNTAAVAMLEALAGGGVEAGLDAEIGRELADAYRRSENWGALVATLSRRVDHLTAPEERAVALRQTADLRLLRLQDAAGAYGDLERAFADCPADAELRGELARAAEASGRWEQLAQAYASALVPLGDGEPGRAVRRALAEVLDRRLGRGAEALDHYRALAGGALPDDLPSLQAMERVMRQEQRSGELAEVLQAILGRTPATEVERRRALFAEVGALYAETLGDAGRAIETYRAWAEQDPKHLEALRRLTTQLEATGQLEALAASLDRLVDLGPLNPQAVEDQLHRAAIMAQLGQPDEAFKSYRAVLLRKREHAAAIEGIEHLAEQLGGRVVEVAQVLEPVYTARQDHEKLAWILEKKLAQVTDAAARKALLRRIGDIFENRLGHKDRAFMMARRSLHEDPADMGVRMWIEKLAGETGALRELADTYVEEGGRCAPPLNVQFFRRAAALFHEKLEDPAAAVGQYEAILAVEGRDEKALAGLEAIFRATQNFDALVDVLRRRLAGTAGIERKRELLGEIATLQAESLGDPHQAVLSLRQLLQLSPDDVAAFARVEQLLAAMSAHEQLHELYGAEIARLQDKRGRDAVARRLELSFRRGRIVDEQFVDRQAAAAIFAAILAEEPGHAATLQYLEGRAEAGAPEAVALLEAVYTEAAAWPKLVDLLERKVAQTPETALRRAIYLQLSAVHDRHTHESDRAFMAVARAFNENRADPELLAQLEAIAAKYKHFEELVDVLSVDLDALPDPQLRQHLLHRLGEICGSHLGQVNEAIGHYRQALQYDPADEVALASLDALLERHEMWAALADLLERRIEVAVEPSAKSLLLERLASLWGDRLMDAEAALRCHRQILEIDPDHPLTLTSMQKLYGELQDWDSLAQNLARQAQVLGEPAEQVRIHAAMGSLFAEELGDNGRSIDAWQRVVALQPAHEEANQALQILLTAEERWEALADLYRRQLTFTQAPAEKLDINRRLGVILGEKLGRTDDALVSWQRVLDQDPKNVDALRSLMALYSERAMWQPFVGVARRLIPLAIPTEAKEVRFALARALGENLGARDDAIRLAREVRATEPHTVAQLDRLAEMLVNIRAWEEAIIALEKAAALAEDPESKIARYTQVAALQRDELHKPNEARGAYEAILEARPADPEAFAQLAQIYRDTAEWRRLVALDEAYLTHVAADQRLPLLTEIRDVQDGKLGEKDMAFIAGCRVYKEDPHDLEAAAVIERIAKECQAADALTAVLEDELDRIVDSDVKVASLRRLARLYADDVGDTAAAEAAQERILQIEPGDLEALDALAALGDREERYDKQIAAWERKLLHLSEEGDKKVVLFEIARVWEDRIGEVDEAIAACQRILQIDGVDMQALDALIRIYQQSGRWTELAHALTRKVEITQDAEQNVGLRLQVAGLCENELKDPEAAIQWYRGVLDFEPGSLPALSSLERLYTSFERGSELIQVFEQQVALAPHSDEQIRLLTKMAAIYENDFDSVKDAAACFERCFAVDPGHLPSIKSLERLLRSASEWVRLIEVMQHHVGLLQDANAVTELYLEIGEVYYRELSRVDRAEAVYNLARESNPRSTAAHHALGKLYERSGNWFQSLEMMQKEAELLGSAPEVLPLLIRLGKINEDMLMDTAAAKAAYQRALAVDETYAPALSALKEIARAAEDWDSYASHLITEAETADDAEQKTELFMEAAKFYQQVRDDEANAIRFYQRALSITPRHAESARALSDIYFRAELWEEAKDLYVIVVAALDRSADPKDFCQKYYRLGYISDKLGDTAAALGFYRQAFEADATYLPALEGYGQALLTAAAWDEALKVFQTILIHHRDALTESEVVETQWQIGDICLRQAQPDRAYKQFEKALETDRDHPASLRALADLDAQNGHWEQAYARLGRYADVAPGPARVPTLLEMARIAEQQLGAPQRMIEPLERARRLGSPSLDVLTTLGHAYLRDGQAGRALDALQQAAALAQQPQQRCELNFQVGKVYEEEGSVKNLPMAVQKYNEALDSVPTHFAAFERIEQILSGLQAWAQLEDNYRQMIIRAKDMSPSIRIVLWRNLADLYRKVLRHVDNAIMAYEVLQKLDPGKGEYTAVLAELYASKPENRAKAIEMQHELLRGAANPVPPIRTLRRLYHAGRDFDAVFVLCSALAFLKEADEEERKLVDYLARGVPPRASRGVSEDEWKLLLEPEVNGPIGQLCAALYRAAPDFVTVPAKDLGLKKKDQLDVRQSELYFANMVRYVAGALNLPPVDVFRKSNALEPLHLVNSQPPALVAGESHEIFRDAAQKVVVYHIARNMAYVRPELFLPRIYVGGELRDLLFGLCIIYNRSLPHKGEAREVERWATTFERLPPPVLKRLQAPAQAAYAELVRGTPLAAYAAAVERVVARVGLLAAGDLGAAARGVTEGGEGAASTPTRDRIRELVLFAVSEPYLQLRRLMGAALAEGKA